MRGELTMFQKRRGCLQLHEKGQFFLISDLSGQFKQFFWSQ